MPRQFFAERPYLAPPKHEFSGPIFGLKSLFLWCWWGVRQGILYNPTNHPTYFSVIL